ncbi:MAG: hypothetical protein ABI346_05515 [Candidatus Baltobacteraceae bacterium]
MPESLTVTHVPPVEDVLGEFVVTLVLTATAYLEPSDGTEPDIPSAEIALDVAGGAFDRIRPRLRPEQHAALSGLLTEARMAVVRKRGT